MGSGVRFADIGVLGLAGLLAWGALTAFYAAFGGPLIEAAFWFYVLNAVIAAGMFALAFYCTAKLRRVPRMAWLYAAMAFAVPGLAAQIGVLTHYNDLAAAARPESLGRYSAFTAFGYLMLVVVAWPRERYADLESIEAANADRDPFAIS